MTARGTRGREVGAAGARSSGLSYQALLDSDTHAVPKVLRLESAIEPGVQKVPVARYTSREFHELEVEKVWKRVWQMACREEDVPEVGDHVVYDIAGLSFLVVRSAPDRIQAFHNACLHRGRLLRETGGRVDELRCAFHGWCWNLDGTLKEVPCEWDFPEVTPARYRLPEVKLGTWGGFVFINPDPEAGPLEAHLGELPSQFERWPLERRFKLAHVAKLHECNWKVAQEAFMEAYHVVATHPQLLPGIADANSQYDVFGSFSRAITPNGTPSPHLRWEPTQQEMLDAMLDRNLDEPASLVVPEGKTAREIAAASRREGMRGVLGDRVDELCDSEMDDSFYFTLFPNFHPWGAYNLITYRFRPYGNDHRSSIMECMFLAPFPEGPRPPAAPVHWLEPDEDWTCAPELGFLARVFNQDVYNLPKIQAGLETLRDPEVVFGSYGETKIRHMHQLLDAWLARP
jgi:phenylpropionate dioxygenase-like ring-hydroxylating dioxygenase large terminal subunit